MRTFVTASNFFSCYAPRMDNAAALGTGQVASAQGEILKLVGEAMATETCTKSRCEIAGTEVMRHSESHRGNSGIPQRKITRGRRSSPGFVYEQVRK